MKRGLAGPHRLGYVAVVAAVAAGQVLGTGIARSSPARQPATIGASAATSVPNQSCTTVSVGDQYTLAVRSDGTVVGMGHDIPSGQVSTTPVALTSPGFISVSGNDSFASFAVRGDGALYAWQSNYTGSLFLGSSQQSIDAPTQVPGLSPVVAASGGSTSLALTADGHVWSAGANNGGQLGIGTMDQAFHSTASATPVTDAIAVAAGVSHELALASDGTIWSWGTNSWGELGYPTPQVPFWAGPYGPSATPAQVPGLSSVIAVAAGDSLSVALEADGSVWTWGAPWSLGYPLNTGGGPSPTPHRVSSLPPVKAIAAGNSQAGNYVLVVLDTGQVMSWGANFSGQLGNGTASNAGTPVAVDGLTDVVEVSASYDHSAALDASGQLWQWGANDSGTFGNGTNTSSLVPVLIGGGYALPYQCTAGPGGPPVPSGGGTVALLGDSYSSGEGAGPYDTGTATSTNSCHRSANSWQRLFVSHALPAGIAFTHTACSGAVLNDYWYANSHNAGEPAQNSVLNTGTSLVLMTLTGNDIGFAEVAQQCIQAGIFGQDACKSKYVINGVDTELQRIQAKQPELTRILADARTRAPNADIHISTYPNIISDDPRLFCLQDGNLPQSDRQWLKSVTRALDDVVVNAANAAGVDVIDVFGAFAGHELCTSDVWANPLASTSSKSEWFHPNAKGYAAWASIVMDTVRVNVGGVDLDGYCKARGYDGASLDGTTAYDWHCDLSGNHYGIDMVDACSWRYGTADAGVWQPKYGNFNDPNSWACWRGTGVNRGGVDLDGYCKARGYDGASLDGTTAYDWHCDVSGTDDNIDMVDACGWQYGLANSGAWEPRYGNFNDPYSWACWRI